MAMATPTPTPTSTPGNTTIVSYPDWSLNDRVNYTGCVLYGIISLAVVLAYCIYHDSRRKWFKIGVHNCFFFFAWSFCIFRVCWLLYRLVNSNDHTAFVLNRMCALLFFSAFSIIVVFWAVNYNKQFDRSKAKRVSKFLKWAFFILNVVLYVLMLVLSIVFIKTTSDDERYEGKPIYETTIALLEALNFIISVGFLIYGSLFIKATWKILRDPKMRLRFVSKILLITVSYSALMALRVAFLLYRPITDKFLNYILFQSCAYYIPEMLPILMQLYFMRARKQTKRPGPSAVTSQSQISQDAVRLGAPELRQTLLSNSAQIGTR